VGTAVAALVTVAAAATPAVAGPPDAAVPYRQVGLTNVGVCGGMSISRNVNAAGTGFVRNVSPHTVSFKGVPANQSEFNGGTVGSCLLSARLGSGSTVPRVMKFTGKLTSEKVNCKFYDQDPAKEPLFGKIAWSLDTNNDFVVDTKMQGYLRVIASDTATNRRDLLWVTGMMTKGAAVGATIAGNFWYAMVEPTKTATGTYDAPNNWVATADSNSEDTWYSVAPGWGYSYKHERYYGNCGQWGGLDITTRPPDIPNFAFGALSTSGFGFGSPSNGFVFLL
jgi:hypothetical protein